MMERLRTWLTLGDYDEAKRNVSRRIVAKQSRGSVSAQNGACMSATKLSEKSHAADADLQHLKHLVEGAQ